jgi:hypothetical protein
LVVSYQQRVRSLWSIVSIAVFEVFVRGYIRNGVVAIHLDPEAIKAWPISEGPDGKVPVFRTL